MLTEGQAAATLAVTDIGRAKTFYAETLGFPVAAREIHPVPLPLERIRRQRDFAAAESAVERHPVDLHARDIERREFGTAERAACRHASVPQGTDSRAD